MSYQDNMTLDEVAAVDLEMTMDAVKNAKRYTFYHPRQALKFTGACVKATMIRLGLPDFERTPHETFDKIQKEKNIKVEHRGRYQGKNLWRNGIYIYQDDVLVSFISEVLVPDERAQIISAPRSATFGGKQEFHVITNARVQ